MIKGTLIPIGGNEDKGYHKANRFRLEYISKGILARVLLESGGKNSKILVVTTASGIPEEVGNMYIDAFRKLGCENVEPLYIGSKAEAEYEANLEKLRTVDCVLFSGGNQSKITTYIKKTEFHKILISRYKNEEFVVAGTSAGAMCMSSEMISGGSSKESFIKASTKMRQGMSLLPDIIIDTHFIQRGRFGRLSEAVARFPNKVGIGLAEDTGMVIKNGDECDIIGSGMVIIFDPGQLTHNNYKILKDGTPLTMRNLVTHVLSWGDKYFISDRRVEVMATSKSLI
ncbi:cyanophycinase [Antarcticibacterium sp. 1MA-6-2]|uniref:cyanophycinase n=1 Tax=Antarcticibacterium sp. 1MA-6-2 TaxID=2908210 RepID=UPI001F29F9CE|nr:cyanophycinase [Antarcticibacterium sp. 1MA-6-2]UJH90823.1 cyanophycinase [Antarcticibacterium sp. 1MA-6-2]